MLKPSWDSECESSLAYRWETMRDLFDAASDAAKPEIVAAWNQRMDRLYMNTEMPESTFIKYLHKADRAFGDFVQ